MIGLPESSSSDTCFDGIYNGNNNEIQNLKIVGTTEFTALFTILGKNGIIENTSIIGGNIDIQVDKSHHAAFAGGNYGIIENCISSIEITSKGSHAAGITGYNYEGGKIINCINKGNITSTKSHPGGIVGNNHSEIINCVNEGAITLNSNDWTIGGISADNITKNGIIKNCINKGKISQNGSSNGGNAGGISGGNNGAQILYSTNYGDINGFHGVGGIVGWHFNDENNLNSETNIIGCANYGYITSTEYTGGIAGVTTSTDNVGVYIDTCVNYGNVLSKGSATTNRDVGGIVGTNSKDNTISNCYNKEAAIRGNESVGGIVGANEGIVYSCYNTGNVTSHTNATSIGGIAGINQATGDIFKSYTQTGKTAKIIGGDIGKSTAQFKNYEDMITYAFVELLNNSTTQWKMGGKTPILVWQDDEEYTGEIEEGIYILCSALNPSNKVMDVANGSIEDNANIQLFDLNYSNAQKFEITKLENDYYKIINVNSGKSLDVANGTTDNGTNLQLYTWNDSAAQHWKFIDYENGYYAIQSELGNYIHVANGQTANATNIHLWQTVSSTNNSNLWLLNKAIK